MGAPDGHARADACAEAPGSKTLAAPLATAFWAINLHRLDRINALYRRQMLAGSQPQC